MQEYFSQTIERYNNRAYEFVKKDTQDMNKSIKMHYMVGFWIYDGYLIKSLSYSLLYVWILS